MKIIYSYLLREFIKPLFFSAGAFGLLVMISEFFRNLNFYLEEKSSFIEVFKYLFLNLPWWIIQVLPVAVLLAVLFSIGQIARHGEITAIKAAGVNLWRIIALFLVCGLFIGLFDLALRELVIPQTSRMADKILLEKIHREKPKSRTEFTDLVVTLPSNGRMTIGYLNTETNTMKDVVIDFYDNRFKLFRQIACETARFSGNAWHLINGEERNFDSNDIIQESHFDEKIMRLDIKPADLVLDDIRPEQKTTSYYKNYIRQLEAMGIPAEKERIQFDMRYSSIFSHLIVMLIGIPFAISISGRMGKIVSFIFALIFAFVYWGVLAVGQSLGENKVLTPFMAAWLGNILFGILGFYFLGKVRK